MKVLIITNLFPNTKEPTRGVFNFQQINELSKINNVEVKIIAPVPWFPKIKIKKRWYMFSQVPNEEVIDGLKVYHPRYLVIPKIMRFLDGVSFFSGIFSRVKKIKKNFDFDCILATWSYPDGFASSLIAKLLKKPLITKVHGSDINRLTKHFLRRKMISYALNRSGIIISVTNDLKEKIIAFGIDGEKVKVIPNGIDTELFKPMEVKECREKLSLPLDKKIILFVGNLVLDKGLTYLIDAFYQVVRLGMGDLYLVILGDGILSKQLQDAVRNKGLDEVVRFINRKPHLEIPLWMNACDLFCLPSLNEGCPNVIIEALACGKPVAASDVGGIPDLIKKEDMGVLVSPGNSKELAQAFQSVIGNRFDPSLLRAQVSSFTWQNNAASLLAELKDAVKEKEYMLKILYHHRTRGVGVEGVHIRQIAKALNFQGNRILMVSPPGVNALKEVDKEVTKKLRFSILWSWISEHLPQIVFEVLEINYNFIIGMKINNLIKKEKVDFIYERYAFFCWIGACLANRNKIPILLEVNEISGIARVREQVLIKLAKYIERKTFQKADAILVVSKFLKEKIMGMGISAKKIHVIPNAVDINVFNLNIALREDLIDDFGLKDKVLLGFVGGFDKWHNFEFLLNTFNEIIDEVTVNVVLMLVGDGPMRVNMEEFIRQNGLEKYVIFTGRLKHSEIPNYIKLMDICIIPQSNEYRSPVKLFEYMAMSKPVIAPKLEPIESIITHNKNGIIFEPNNSEALKTGILDLVNNEEKRKRIGKEAHNCVMTKHLWEYNANRLINIYNSIKDRNVPILMYHDILPDDFDLNQIESKYWPYITKVSDFEQQMSYFTEEGYHPISLDQFSDYVIYGKQLPSKSIIITFDDGLASNYKYAFPILNKYGFTAVFFVIAGRVDSEGMLSWTEIEEMCHKGMTFGSHTLTHPIPSQLTREELRYELAESKRILEHKMGVKIRFLSSPTGYLNKSISSIAKETGYDSVCIGTFGMNSNHADLFSLKRIAVKRNYGIKTFESLLNEDSGEYKYYRRSQRIRSFSRSIIGVQGYEAIRNRVLKSKVFVK